MTRTVITTALALLLGTLATHAYASKPLSRMPEVKGTERVPLGVTLKNCDDPGVHIKAVTPGSPATRCQDQNSKETVSLEAGDHVLAVNDETVAKYQELIDRVESSPEEIKLQVRDSRTGKIRYLVTYLKGKSEPVEEDEPPAASVVKADRLGIDCYECTEGIHVTAVAQGGAATRLTTSTGETRSLAPGDHILSVNGKSTSSTASFLERLQEAPTSCDIRVKDHEDGKLRDLRVRLD